MKAPETIEEVRDALAGQRYLVDEGLATVSFLALQVRRPLLVEGEPGVGKTELAKALAAATDVPLVRLQCYEGIDVHHALYDWDYQRQLLHLRAEDPEPLYSERFLVRRPLLEAISNPGCVLLIDELDRADDEFEAFLLEFLSDFQVTIPEIGTVEAERPPVVVITSNRTRELHDALRRRCLYHWIDHPDLARETAIVRSRLPEVPEALAAQACAFVEQLRWLDLYRVPGVGETLDWTQSLVTLGASGGRAGGHRPLARLAAQGQGGHRAGPPRGHIRADRSGCCRRPGGRRSEPGGGVRRDRAQDRLEVSGWLMDAVVALARGLRSEGIATTVDQELALAKGLAAIDIREREQVRWAARACFLRGPHEEGTFERVFDRFWKGQSLSGPHGPVAEHGETDPRMPGPQHGGESLPQFRLEGRSGHLLDGGLSRAGQEIPTAGGAGARARSSARRARRLQPGGGPYGCAPARLRARRARSGAHTW